MFDIQDNEISKRYVEEYNAVSGYEELAAHCKKWQDVLGFDTPPVGASLAEYTEHKLLIDGGGVCPCINKNTEELQAEKKTCMAISLKLPIKILVMMITAQEYGAPEGVAYHQLYCKDPEHTNCF